jgi:hypothetical protein
VNVCAHCGQPIRDQLALAPLSASPDPATKARKGDRPTSLSAAKLAFPRAGNARRLLLETIARTTGGLTAEQASERSGVKYVTASTRLTELVRAGWLRDTGETRRTSAGTPAAVLVATETARAELAKAAQVAA